MIHKTLTNKTKRALNAFTTIMRSDFDIYSFSCTGSYYHDKRNETGCRIICQGYQCDCLWHRGFEDNLILACALMVYCIKVSKWINVSDRYGMWKVTYAS